LKAEQIQIRSHQREELIDITGLAEDYLGRSGVVDGFLVLFVPHTTAAVTINENADPAVTRDIVYKLHKELPPTDDYLHSEGNSDAHIKSSLVGPSLQMIISGGKLILGRWQAIYFCEFDGPRIRNLLMKAIAD